MRSKGEEMGKPPLTFLRNGKKNPYNGKRCPKYVLFWMHSRALCPRAYLYLF